MTRDELYMKKALELAEIAAEQGGSTCGCDSCEAFQW